MLPTIACGLLLAATTWAGASARADDDIAIPFELAADGSVPYVDLADVPRIFPTTTPSRSLLGNRASSHRTTVNNNGYKASYGGSSAPKRSATRKRHGSSVSCTAYASSKSFTASRDAHVNAVAYAVKRGCAAGKFGKRWFKHVSKQFKLKAGWAVAAAWASAETYCESKGHAEGCATAYAYAAAWSEATVSAHALAFAKALNKCRYCKGKYQAAKADSYGFAEKFKTIVAEVEAVAKSKTCVRGHAKAGNKVYSKCIQEIYAVAFAKAVAEALIEGKCGWYYGSSKLKAAAYIDAKAVIETWEYVDC